MDGRAGPAQASPLRVSRLAARRFLIRRSGLFGPGRSGEGGRAGPASLESAGPATPRGLSPQAGRRLEAGTLALVRSLEYVQVDPMVVLAQNQHLVLGARVPGYRPDILDHLLYGDRKLAEVVAADRYIVPIEDYPLFRLGFRLLEHRHRPSLAALEPVMRDVLERLRVEGPLSSLDIEDDRKVSGWWDPGGENRTKAVRQALEWLWHFGRVAVSHRVGSRRYFDLTERVFGEGALGRQAACPDGPIEEVERAFREGAARKYFRAMGLSDPTRWHFGWVKRKASDRLRAAEDYVAAGVLLSVSVEGSRKTYYLPAEEAGDLARAESWEPPPEVRFLAPLDNLIWDRDRLSDIFAFNYTWEAYVPAPKRKYGPYTCPILYGDSFAGRIDARVDRRERTLVVNGLWWEDGEGLHPRASSDPLLPSGVLVAALERWAALCGATAVADPRGVLRQPSKPGPE